MRRQSKKLMDSGQPVNWIGVNFWSRAGGPRMWKFYDSAVVGEELRIMREHGMTLTRSFFYWADFMPTADSLDETMIVNYLDFLDQHSALGMTTIPTFLVGHMSGENWDPSWRGGRDLYSDVWFVARQSWYVRELTARFAAHPAVAGWLLTNEVPIYGDEAAGGFGSNDPAVIHSWSELMMTAVRAGGATQPVSIGDGVWGLEASGRDNGFRVRELAPLIDFHGPHVYRMETDPIRQNLAAAFICELLDIGGLPVVVEEFGLTSDYVSEENAAHYYRQVLHNTLLAGATGWLAWNNTDYDDLAHTDPYSHHPFEMHFGLTDSRGVPKAQALEMKSFAQLAKRLDFPHLSRPDAQAVMVVSSFLEVQYPFTQPEDATNVLEVARQAYIAAKEADVPVGVAREVDGLPDDCRLYLLPSTKQLTAPTWRHLRDLAEQGATVYASYFVGDHGPQRGLWWPDVDATFGVTKLTRYGLVDLVTDDEVTFRFLTDFGGIEAGTEMLFTTGGSELARSYLPVNPDGAEVIAVDAHDRPALLRYRRGQGSMVLSTYPIEYFAAMRPESNPEQTWRIYDALANVAGVERSVSVTDPRVLVSEMVHDDGQRYAWLVSQSPEASTVTPTVGRGHLEDLDGNAVSQLTLSPYGVTILAITD